MSFRFIILAIVFSVALHSLSAKEKQGIQVLNFNEFEPYLNFSNDTVYVINFWATWCIPCRKELPEFEKIHREDQSKKIKVLLVSLDSPSGIDNSLLPFLHKNGITAKVLLLHDPDSNAWIDKVDPSWSGSLPATVIYNKSVKKFFEMELSYELIHKTVNELSNL
ncbi:MAG: TlpA family protein disulfide reductase [Bacteroidales bacterium]|nr:TlpA family protein disulfide reductase [Bacteroidales bacterium]